MAVVLLVRPLVDPVIDSVNEPIEIMKVEFRTADDRRTDKRMNFSLQSACTEKAPNRGQPCSEWQKSSPAPKTMTRQRRHFTQQRSYFTCHIRATGLRVGDHINITYGVNNCDTWDASASFINLTAKIPPTWFTIITIRRGAHICPYPPPSQSVCLSYLTVQRHGNSSQVETWLPRRHAYVYT